MHFCASEKITADAVSYNWYGINLFHGLLNVHFNRLCPLLYRQAGCDCPTGSAGETQDFSPDLIYLDKGLTWSNRQRLGLNQVLATARSGDTLVVPKLDRLPRSVSGAREIADALQAKGRSWRWEPTSMIRKTPW